MTYAEVAATNRWSLSKQCTQDVTAEGTWSDQNHSLASGWLEDSLSRITLSRGAAWRDKLHDVII